MKRMLYSTLVPVCGALLLALFAYCWNPKPAWQMTASIASTATPSLVVSPSLKHTSTTTTTVAGPETATTTTTTTTDGYPGTVGGPADTALDVMASGPRTIKAVEANFDE